MTRPDISRHVLDAYATDLRRQVEAAKHIAANADIHGRKADAQQWTGHAAGLMEAHGLLMTVLTADQSPLSIGDEIRFVQPQHATPRLLWPDATYDVTAIADGMVTVRRSIHREYGDGALHQAPITAVERCFTANPGAVTTEAGA
jgi:hypothetical protein